MRQIIDYDIAFDKSRELIQRLVDRSMKASRYYSNAYPVYTEVYYEGAHTSLKNKGQIYTVEAVKSDFRAYIPARHHRSKVSLAL